MKSLNLQNMNGSIYVGGFMASGKSTVGRKLAEFSELPFCDLDKIIEQREGMTIVDIFEKKGEAYFREKERQYLLELPETYNGIVSLGGGSLQDQEVVDQLRDAGTLLFIDTPLEIIVERVYRKKHRPILYDEEGKIKSKQALFDELKALYSARIKFYKQAQVSLDTTISTSASRLAKTAIEKIKEHV